MNNIFQSSVHNVAKSYMAFLRARVPADIEQQMYYYAELYMPYEEFGISLEDVMRPLKSGTLPGDKHFWLASALGDGVTRLNLGLNMGDEKHPYLVIYLCSLYLYCYLAAGKSPEASGYKTSLWLLITVCATSDIETRLQVSRFLSALVPMVPSHSYDVECHRSSLLVSLILILSATLVDAADVCHRTMIEENVVANWDYRHRIVLEHEIVAKLQSMVERYYGAGGDIQKAAEQLLCVMQPRP